MDENNSRYEDADSKANKEEMNYYNDKEDYNQYKFGHNNKLNNINQSETLDKNENKRNNQAFETNIIMDNNINNDDSHLNSNYSSPREVEIQFEKEKTTSYCSTCSCFIF